MHILRSCLGAGDAGSVFTSPPGDSDAQQSWGASELEYLSKPLIFQSYLFGLLDYARWFLDVVWEGLQLEGH